MGLDKLLSKIVLALCLSLACREVEKRELARTCKLYYYHSHDILIEHIIRVVRRPYLKKLKKSGCSCHVFLFETSLCWIEYRDRILVSKPINSSNRLTIFIII